MEKGRVEKIQMINGSVIVSRGTPKHKIVGGDNPLIIIDVEKKQREIYSKCSCIGCVNKPTITIDKLDFCTQHTPIHCKDCKSADSVVFANTQKFKDPDSRDMIISTKWFCKLCHGSFRTERRIGDLERFPRGKRRR